MSKWLPYLHLDMPILHKITSSLQGALIRRLASQQYSRLIQLGIIITYCPMQLSSSKEHRVLSQQDLQNLSWSEIKVKHPAADPEERVLNNRDRLRKLSQHDFVQQIKLFQKRITAKESLKQQSNSEDGEKQQNDDSFRSAKLRLLGKTAKKQPQPTCRDEREEVQEIQELGYLTFKMIRERQKATNAEVFKKHKADHQTIQFNVKRRTVGS